MAAAAPPPQPDLVSVLAMLAEDAFFTVAGTAKLDAETLHALAHKRAGALAATARGHRGPGIDAWDPWILELCAALASVAPPRWMPLADAVEGGLSLSHGARGVRSLFTSKPSDKDVLRVRGLGGAAVRAITSVLAATGPLSAEALLQRDALLHALGLSEGDRREIAAEPPVAAEMLDLHGDLFENKMARSIVRSAFFAARADGTDPREEQAAVTIARKLGLTTEETNQAREDARAQMDGGRDFGEASVEAIRYVLAGTPESDRFAVTAARLALSPIQRHDAITAINVGGPVVLSRRHKLDRQKRDAALALSWLAVLSGNPTVVRSAELGMRHDKLAADLGDEGEGIAVRSALARWIESELDTAAKAYFG